MAVSDNVAAHQIKHALSKRHKSKDYVYLTEVKTGPTWGSDSLLILDAVHIKRSWAKPCIKGYEVKVSRSDFRTDSKWPHYMDHCHEFYFVCPKGLITKEDLQGSPEVGLIWYSDDYKSTLYTRRSARFRNIDLPWPMFYHLTISHMPEDRQHPFFSSTREYLEAYVEDKATRRWLGREVGTKLAKEVGELAKEIDDLENDLRWANKKKEKLEQVSNVLAEHGIHIRSFAWEGQLRQHLEAEIPPKLKEGVQQAAHYLRKAQEAMGDADGDE